MRIHRHRHRYQVPGLNTASLPDLIFTVLFFFMIVTHMRKEEIKVKYRMPQGTELTRLTKQSTVYHIYIGALAKNGRPDRIQINDKLVNIKELENYLQSEKRRLSPEDKQRLSVSLRADRDTPMQIVGEVKTALRKSDVLRINYLATPKSTSKKTP